VHLILFGITHDVRILQKVSLLPPEPNELNEVLLSSDLNEHMAVD